RTSPAFAGPPAELLPGVLCQRVLCLADALPRFAQRCQLVWCELSEALESRVAGKRSDTHQAHDFCRRQALSNPGQELNEVQLIEEVVLKPQDQLIVRLETFDRGSP